MDKLIKTGARKGENTIFRKWLSKLAAPVLIVLPVPGEDYFRSHRIYLDDFFDVASHSREANVLLVGGKINKKLAQKVAVVYLQMPRPRALVFAGVKNVSPLPEPDLQVELNVKDIHDLKFKLIKMLQKPYRKDAENFKPDFVKEMIENGDEEGGHQHHHQHEEGHDDQGEGHEHHGKHNSHQGKGNEQEHEHNGKSGENHKEHDSHSQKGHDNGGHNHSGMGFMSMVKMTRDMPRAADGLAMERNSVWVGPFSPGFPGGLAFQFTIDGDTVVKVKAEKKLFENSVSVPKDISPEQFLKELAALNPITPHTYRILGEQLLMKSLGKNLGLSRQQIILLERERILSHLNWFSTLGNLAGNQWLRKEAALRMRIFQKNNSLAGLMNFTRKIHGFRLLKNKLQSTGKIPEVLLHHASGPVARAAGRKEDMRSTEKIYLNANFESVSLSENNAWGRLEVRLQEIDQAIQIMQKLKIEADKNRATEEHSFGKSSSFQLEGPAGTIKAELQTENGQFRKLTVNDASAIHTLLAEQIVKEMEFSDALNTIASLDIKPFAMSIAQIGCQNK